MLRRKSRPVSGSLTQPAAGRVRFTEFERWHWLQSISSDTGSTTEVLEWPAWILYLAIPLGSYLMCFRFLQVAWSFHRTGELPHHDHGHVEGLDEEAGEGPPRPGEEDLVYRMEDELHPRDFGDGSDGKDGSARR